MADQVTLENTSHNEMPSLLVPIGGGEHLLLPTVSVAEMLPYKEPKYTEVFPEEGVPQWYLGDVLWRGVQVPMVSYEAINEQPMPEVKVVSQMVVLNNTGVHPKLPFICFPSQGIPRLNRVTKDDIAENLSIAKRPYDKLQVIANGESAAIPDVEKIEHSLVELMKL